MTPSPVAARAQELGLPVIKADKIDAEAAAAIAAAAPEVAAIVAYGALIPASALTLPTHGWINLHFSLLPAWRGAAPVQHSVINGDQITGASTFLLEKGLDTGPVYGTMTESIRPTDTSAALLDRLSHSGAILLAQTIDGLGAGALSGVPNRVRSRWPPSSHSKTDTWLGANPPWPSTAASGASPANPEHGPCWPDSVSNSGRC
ncbi:formyltransferase family protein [Arthrobacter alpinus]|nr:formyltransferase family protein [Arthrobacter alpinus]